MPLVSVIVPFYNTEKYISRCIKSLLGQTLSDIEFIFIDDFSKDNSLNIVLEYAAKDKRIKVIRNDKNIKQGASRNKGIEAVRGEYIGFVDSDDWVDSDYFEKLYKAAKKYDSDIALATNVRIGNGKTKKRLNIENEEFIRDLQGKFDITSLAKNPCPTNKIYRASFLKGRGILYPENCYCEDKLFVTKAVYFANGVVSTPGVNYYYFRNPNSTVNSKAKKHIKELIDDKNRARAAVIEFLRERRANIKDVGFKTVRKEISLFGLSLIKVVETLRSVKIYLFCVPVFKKTFGEGGE